MKRIALTILAASAIYAASAQQPWTLDMCIDYAVTHNLSVKAREIEHRSAELSVTEAKSRFLPELSAGASQSFNFGRGLTSDNTYANRNTSQFGWNVGLSLPLFQGLSSWRNLKLQKANLTSMAMQVNAVKDDVTIRVIAQYLQVLYASEVRNIAAGQIEMSQVQLERQRTLFQNGKIAELDVTLAESQLAQDKLAEVNAVNDYNLALLDLTRLLQLPDTEGFAIAPITDTEMPLLSADDIYRNALHNNSSILAADLSVKAAERTISVARAGYLPRLSFNAGLGSSYYNLAGTDNPPFHRQMRDNFNKSLGFTLSIPIFDALSTRNSVKRAQIQKLQAEIQAEQTRSDVYQAIQQAYTQAVGAEKKQNASAIAAEATKAALTATETKYNYGRANATEYEQARTNHLKASIEATQAKYEWLLRLRILNFYNRTSQ